MLGDLLRAPEPLTVIDTHAGAGTYSLRSEAAAHSGEASAGVERLLDQGVSQPELADLKAAVSAARRRFGADAYPGSPSLIADALRPGDRYVGCELREDDHALLRRALSEAQPAAGWEALREDGYAAAVRLAGAVRGRLLLLIDPPYERGDDPARIADTLAAVAVARGRHAAPALIWAPIKDLESYDALLRRMEALPFVEGWAAEARLRPLTDPMRLNGSAMIGLGLRPPSGLEAICGWTAEGGGDAGALGRVTKLFD